MSKKLDQEIRQGRVRYEVAREKTDGPKITRISRTGHTRKTDAEKAARELAKKRGSAVLVDHETNVHRHWVKRDGKVTEIGW